MREQGEDPGEAQPDLAAAAGSGRGGNHDWGEERTAGRGAKEEGLTGNP